MASLLSKSWNFHKSVISTSKRLDRIPTQISYTNYEDERRFIRSLCIFERLRCKKSISNYKEEVSILYRVRKV